PLSQVVYAKGIGSEAPRNLDSVCPLTLVDKTAKGRVAERREKELRAKQIIRSENSNNRWIKML
ncbi:MAG: hypothetical protein ACLP9L_34235, partial [Thermoguttaceae bacterium]